MLTTTVSTTSFEAHVDPTGIRCNRCAYVGSPGDQFCRNCGNGGRQLAAAASWHLAAHGKPSEPLSVQHLTELRDAGRLRPDTPVWREGLPEWLPASSTELLDLFHDQRPPHTPPPLPPTAIDNRIIWVLAFAPAIGVFLQGFISELFEINFDTLWWIVIVINVALAVADERRLQAAGHSTDGWGAWAWFLIPVYLFQRASKLGQTPSYAWAWVVVFIVTLLFG